MSGETVGRFDPRHDPIFQRGYQPRDERVTDAAASVAHAAPTTGVEANVSPDALSAPIVDDESAVEAQRTNPFIRALWIVGVGLIALGLLLQWQANVTSGFASSWNGMGDKPFDLVLLQMLWFVASPALQVGSLTIVGLLFWHAAQWRPPHRAD